MLPGVTITWPKTVVATAQQMQSFIIFHPSHCVFYLPVVVMGLAADFFSLFYYLWEQRTGNDFMSPSPEAVRLIAEDY